MNDLLNIVDIDGFNLLKNIMTTTKNENVENDEKDKILKGLEKTYEKLLEFKRSKNSVLVVMRDNKIVKIKP